ncbi:MAG: hypothetical protein ACRENB_06915 [Gemmatimonadales bacterium]
MKSVWLAGAALLAAAPALAQGDCFPSETSNEARTMAIFDVPLAFSAAAAPVREPAGRLRIGLEASYLPDIDDETATPTTCRPGKGPENTDFLFAAPRPRVVLTLPAGLRLEASWIPPIRLNEAKANLFGLSLGTAFPLGGSGTLGIRGHATVGKIEAPITCDDDALADVTSECYLGTRSNDSFKPNIFGVEAAVGWALGGSLRPYLGLGYNHLAPRFRVNFTNRNGEVDRRRVTVDLDRAVLFAGATWAFASSADLSAEIYSAPTDAVTGRVAGRIRLR